MNLSMQEASDGASLRLSSYTIGFHGTKLDDRGDAAVAKLTAVCPQLIEIHYNADLYEVCIGSETVHVDDFVDAFQKYSTYSIVLEATTLGFVEILLCCKALHHFKVATFDLLYVEPMGYHSPRHKHILHKRDFTLSGNVPGYNGIPGFSLLFSDRVVQKGVFFVGYEESRLRRAFEDLQMIQPEHASITFGVPAFKPGWEMDAIANNITVIRDQNIRGGLHFCGAENPLAVIELLNELYDSLNQNQRLFIAPIGTKPHGIGVALFVSAHPDVGIIYDHPHRKQRRTEKTSRWHLFSVTNF